MSLNQEEKRLFSQGLEELKTKLIDTSRRNKLINYRAPQKSRNLRIIDELPDFIVNHLVKNEKKFKFKFIPEPIVDFSEIEKLKNKKRTFEIEIDDLKLVGNPENNLLQIQELQKKINQIELTIKELLDKKLLTPEERAQELNFNISKELPKLDLNDKLIDERHIDDALQTLHYPSEMEKILTSVERNARSIIEETGSNMLYLSLGFLRWNEAKNSEEYNKSPLVSIPITITKSKSFNRYVFTIEYSQEGIDTNRSLTEKLLSDYGIIFPELTDELSYSLYIEQVKLAIATQVNWEIKHEVFLDFLHFGKILMYQDLKEENWINECALINNSILQDIFIGKEITCDSTFSPDYEIDKHPKADTIPLVMDADSSQHSAIIDVIDGKNVIIEGPPGTGKSQTIANIIAGLISKGKSVLFVSEKLAALQVVHKRLSHVGLSDFCLELHSHKSQKNIVLKSIEQRIDSYYPDIKTLENIIDEIEHKKDILKNYIALIHREFGNFNRSVFDILWSTEKNHHASKYLSFKIEGIGEYSCDTFKVMNEELEKYHRLISNYTFEDCYWKGFNTHNLNFIDIDNFMLNLKSMHDIFSVLDDKFKILPFTLEDEYHQLDQINSLMKNAKVDKEVSSLLKLIHSDKIPFKDSLLVFVKLDESISSLSNDIKRLYSLNKFNSNFRKSILEISNIIKTLSKEINIPINVDIYYIKMLLKSLSSLSTIDKKLYVFATLEYGGIYFENKLIQAKQEHQLCQDFKDEISMHLKIDVVESKDIEEILHVEKVIQSNKDSFFCFLSKDFRDAKIVLSSMLKGELPKDKIVWLKYLHQIKHYNKIKYEFENNIEYKTCFKNLFKGENTQWESIWELHNWAIKLRKEIKNIELHTLLLSGDEYIYDALSSMHVGLADAISSFDENINQIPTIYGQRNVGKLYASKDDLNLFELLNIIELFDENIKKILEIFSSYENELDDFSINELIKVDFKNLFKVLSMIPFEIGNLALNLENTLEHIAQLNINLKQINSAIDSNLEITNQSKVIITEALSFYENISSSKLSNQLKDFLLDDYENNFNTLSAINESIEKLMACNLINEQYGFLSDSFYGNQPILISQCLDKLDQAPNHKNMLSIWSEFRKITESLKQLGLAPIIEKFENKELPLEMIIPSLHYNFFNTLTREIFRKYPEMNNFNRLSHEQTIEKFKALDIEFIAKNRERVAFLATQNVEIPHGYRSGAIKELTQLSLIKHEIGKKKKHIPIRQLVKRAGAALKGLKPCFMMSPLSVSQYLPPNEVIFDVLVIDEASQLKPEEAIGTIARVKQIVIVGDPKQLPPTSFFDSIDKSSDDESMISESESILDFCLNLYQPIRQLKWHYRSQHETLIDFSNQQFYDGNLIVFPSPTKASNDELGIKYHYIKDAVYQDRKNKLEAKNIIEFLENQMRRFPDRSIGVGTFNTEQRDLIQGMIDEREKSSPIVAHYITKWENTNEPFFVKNLENLQGDERDIICISTTFGKDKETQKVYQRFGPINSDMGWRRLNVLFTRSKQKMEVFTSMLSSDIIIAPTSSRGVIALKAFLTYVETGTMSGAHTNTHKDFDSEFEVSVNNLLLDCGYTVVPQVGVAGYFIDLAVVSKASPNEYILGIECDGATYHSSKSARDRDRLKQDVLEKLGWKIYRIWSVDWFKNRDNEIKKLIEVVQIAQNGMRTKNIEKPVIDNMKDKTLISILDKSAEVITTIKPKIVQQEIKKEHVFSSNDSIKQELIKLRDEVIAKDYEIDRTCILSPLMIDLLIKHKPLDMDEFRNEIPLKIRQSINSEQLVYMNEVFEILEKADE